MARDTRPPCPACDGTGKVRAVDCRVCSGSGRKPRVVVSGKVHGELRLSE